MVLTEKQGETLDYLEDDYTNELIFGGGAGGAKSFLGCYWILKMCLKYKGIRCLIGRKKLKTLKETTLKTFFEVCKLQGIKSGVHYNMNSQTNTITFFNGSEILLKDLFQYPSDREFDELGSLEITCAFIDEVNQVVEKAWQIVKSRIRFKLDEYGLIPKILGTCNPSKNWVYNEFYKPARDFILADNKQFIQSLVTDNPFISKHYIENLKSLPQASKERLLYGNWEADDDPSKLIEYDNILSMFNNSFVADDTKSHYITCDVARLGSDKAVIMVWRGFEVVKVLEYDISRIDELQTVIRSLIQKYKVPLRNVIADEDGVGGGLVDNLNIKGFVNNSKAKNDENYQNLKTQCYYKLAETIMNDKIYIGCSLTTDQKECIIQDLEQVKSDNSDDGKLKILSKSKVKDLIGRSPDYSDALMMRMYWNLKPTIKKYSIY
jgi:PBSX family phage terminase large subunit